MSRGIPTRHMHATHKHAHAPNKTPAALVHNQANSAMGSALTVTLTVPLTPDFDFGTCSVVATTTTTGHCYCSRQNSIRLTDSTTPVLTIVLSCLGLFVYVAFVCRDTTQSVMEGGVYAELARLQEIHAAKHKHGHGDDEVAAASDNVDGDGAQIETVQAVSVNASSSSSTALAVPEKEDSAKAKAAERRKEEAKLQRKQEAERSRKVMKMAFSNNCEVFKLVLACLMVRAQRWMDAKLLCK